VLRVRAFDAERSVFFATKGGTVKKTPLESFSRPRQAGIWAIQLDEDDELVGVGLARPGDTIILGTAKGKAIRFDEKAARAMGRTAHGVRGIKLLGDDRVVSVLVAHDPGGTVFTACEHGFGKRTPLDEYPVKNRGGQGVINIRTSGRNGDVIGIALCTDGDDVMFITQSGMIVRSPVSEMRPMGRGTQGVRLINLKEDDRLVSTEIVSAEDIRIAEEAQPSALEIEPASTATILPAPPPGGRVVEDDDDEEEDEVDDEDLEDDVEDED
jgi:DNA gyrase subunit A